MEDGIYKNPGRQRYLANYLAIAVTMIGSFCAYRFCFHFYGEEALALYAVSRRMLSYGIAFVASGLGVSLCYHVADDRASEQTRGRAWLIASFVPLSICVLLLVFLAWSIPDTIGAWLFGDAKWAFLVPPLTLLMVTIGVQILLAYYCTGRMEIVRSSLLTAVVSGVIPIVSFFLFPGSLSSFLWGTATLGLACCAVFYGAFIHPNLGKQPVTLKQAYKCTRDVVTYAAGRVPGGFLVVVILNLPVSFATHSSQDLTAAAAVSIGVALVELVATGVTPLSNIYLPQAAYLAARGRAHELWRSSLRVFCLVTAFSVSYVLGLAAFIDQFLALFLGSWQLGYAPYVVKILPAAPFYALFRCFRGLLDGVSRIPLTTLNTLLSLAFFGLVFVLSGGNSAVDKAALGLVMGMGCLGVLTTVQIYWYLRTPSESRAIEDQGTLRAEDTGAESVQS
ncbi:MAG: hypothetical protein WC314_13070 [Vulcanimicrobiota bacterium]